MKTWVRALWFLAVALPLGLDADMRTITVDSMVQVVFTGDSQTTGRNLAIDYPQLLSRVLPVRVINTAVGGSNSEALMKPMSGGSVRLRQGERVLYGTEVSWGMGPYPGMRVTVHGEVYTIDAVEEHPPTRNTELHLLEPARADYEGTDYSIEPGWEVRVARHRPAVVCVMYINDGAMPAARLENWRELIRRCRAMGAVPVLMSPFPADDATHGGNHPGFHEKVLQNAAAVQALALAENTWFVDVCGLTLALDPPLRCQVGDGIHPDTDGQTAAMDGLLRAFGQMGLTQARPLIKAWMLTGAPAPLAELLATGVRPFRTSQPDHPDPDHQSEKGFTLAAVGRNDEYGLIAAADGAGVALGPGLLLHLGLEREAKPQRLTLRLTGSGLAAPQLWDAAAGAWLTLAASAGPAGLSADLPLGALRDAGCAVLVTGAAEALLDAVALDVEEAAVPARWLPAPTLSGNQIPKSDHTDAGNLLRNADFAAEGPGRADPWTLVAASVNRPFRVPVEQIGFTDEADLRLAALASPTPPRPYDLIVVGGSQAGNDGAYRVRDLRGDGRVRVRRRAKAAEAGLAGELVHDDGCRLVPGGCCVEVSPGGRAETTFDLPAAATALDLSVFTRVYAPTCQGTRDLPGRQSDVALAFFAADGQILGAPWRLAAPADSFQWRKLEGTAAVPPGAAQARLTLAASGPGLVQFTGVCARLTPAP